MQHHLKYFLDEVRWGCPCGARSDEPYGLCRKCRARAAWSRRNGRKRKLAFRAAIRKAMRR